MWQLRSTLEEEALGSEALGVEVSAAAIWILYGGEELAAQRSDAEPDATEARMTKAGALYMGRPGLCEERWAFWKRRFAEAAGLVSGDAKTLATRASEMM